MSTSTRSCSMACTSAMPRARCAFTRCPTRAPSKSPTSPAGLTSGSSAHVSATVVHSTSSTTPPTSLPTTSQRSRLATARRFMISNCWVPRLANALASSCIRSARSLRLVRRSPMLVVSTCTRARRSTAEIVDGSSGCAGMSRGRRSRRNASSSRPIASVYCIDSSELGVTARMPCCSIRSTSSLGSLR